MAEVGVMDRSEMDRQGAMIGLVLLELPTHDATAQSPRHTCYTVRYGV